MKVRAAVLVALLLGVVGCTAQTTSVKSTGPAAGGVQVTVRVLGYGGPLNPVTGKSAMNGTPQPNVRVTITTPGFTVSGPTDEQGRVVFHVDRAVTMSDVSSNCGKAREQGGTATMQTFAIACIVP